MRAKVVLSTLALAALLTAATATLHWQQQARTATASTSATGMLAATACTLPNTDSQHPGMVFVPAGKFTMGSDQTYSEESPATATSVDGFWMDQTEVTNAQFAEFVAATGYKTLAERGLSNPDDPSQAPIAGSAVFAPPYTDGQPDPFRSWWQFQLDADWQHPEGPASDITGREQHPVVHIAYEDAEAYANWKGHHLPSEAQFEYAAQSSARTDSKGQHIANTWQGLFPFQHESSDGFASSSPVGCYPANAFGLFDLVGNVWEWTDSAYYDSHDFAEQELYPEGYDPRQPGEPVAVIKGGSYLCAPNYCMRYRPEARQGQSKGLGTSHIGFRTVVE